MHIAQSFLDLCNRWDIVNLVGPLIPRRCIVTRCKYNRKGKYVGIFLNFYYEFSSAKVCFT